LASAGEIDSLRGKLAFVRENEGLRNDLAS